MPVFLLFEAGVGGVVRNCGTEKRSPSPARGPPCTDFTHDIAWTFQGSSSFILSRPFAAILLEAWVQKLDLCALSWKASSRIHSPDEVILSKRSLDWQKFREDRSTLIRYLVWQVLQDICILPQVFQRSLATQNAGAKNTRLDYYANYRLKELRML